VATIASRVRRSEDNCCPVCSRSATLPLHLRRRVENG
jgi:hypothetical protein